MQSILESVKHRVCQNAAELTVVQSIKLFPEAGELSGFGAANFESLGLNTWAPQGAHPYAPVKSLTNDASQVADVWITLWLWLT